MDGWTWDADGVLLCCTTSRERYVSLCKSKRFGCQAPLLELSLSARSCLLARADAAWSARGDERGRGGRPSGAAALPVAQQRGASRLEADGPAKGREKRGAGRGRDAPSFTKQGVADPREQTVVPAGPQHWTTRGVLLARRGAFVSLGVRTKSSRGVGAEGPAATFAVRYPGSPDWVGRASAGDDGPLPIQREHLAADRAGARLRQGGARLRLRCSWSARSSRT